MLYILSQICHQGLGVRILNFQRFFLIAQIKKFTGLETTMKTKSQFKSV